MSEAVAGVSPVATAPLASRWRAAIARRFATYGGAPGARLVGVDIARGIAVLGMFVAHTASVDGFDWARPDTWLDIANGRSSILFATLAGVSIALISGRQVPLDGTALLQARMRILIRAVLIFALGGLLEFLGTPVAVILPMYALLFVLSLPFLRWKPWALFVLAGSLAITMPFAQLVLSSLIAERAGAGVIVDLFVTGVYPGMIWIVFVIVGLAIGRLDLGAVRVRVWLLLVGLVLAVVGYGIGAAADAAQPPTEFGSSGSWSSGSPSGSPGSSESSGSSSGSEIDIEEGVPADELDFDGLVCDRYDSTISCYPEGFFGEEGGESPGLDEPTFMEQVRSALTGLFTARAHSGTTVEVLASGGFALLVIALALLASTPRVLRWILFPVAAVGSMALTAYSGHIVALAILAYTDPGSDVLLVFTLTALIACSAWVLLIGRGPLERLLTRVSHRAAHIVTPRAVEESNHPIPRA